MSDDLYMRWSALVDAETGGAELTDVERELCEQVPHALPLASAEQALVDQLSHPVETPPSAHDRALVDAALAEVTARDYPHAYQVAGQHGLHSHVANARIRRRWLGAGLGAAASIAVAAALLWRGAPPAVPAAPPPPFRAELVYTSGEVHVAGQPGGVGAGVLQTGQVVETRAGRACLVIDPGIDLCVGEYTRVRIRQPTAHDRGLALLAGTATASLEKQPEGSRFSITAGDVVATAMGTVFAVARAHDGTDDVIATTVSEGVVKVEGPTGGRLVRAHERAVHSRASGQLRVTSVTRMEEARVRGAVELARLWHDGLSATIELVGPEADEALVDGRPIGKLPLVTVMPAGLHSIGIADGQPQVVRLAAGQHARLELSATSSEMNGDEHADAAPADRRPEAAPGEGAAPDHKGQRARLAANMRAVAAGPTAQRRARQQRGGPTHKGITRLMERARDHALSHRFAAAAGSYEALRRQYGSSPEAHAVLVTLGDLQLSRLAEPRAALRSYDGYLSQGGPLAEEAMLGRVRALEQLRRPVSERRALARFLARFPDSPHRPALTDRLESLQRDAR